MECIQILKKEVKPKGAILEIGELKDGIYDVIYCTNSISQEERSSGSLIVQQGEAFLRSLDEQYPMLKTIRYSDNDLQLFSEGKGDMSFFFASLHKRGQITDEQYERFGGQPKQQIPADPLFDLVQRCIQNHMRKGSQITALLQSSQYENPHFFEHFIVNPDLSYEERECGDSIVMVITKKG